MTSKFDKKTKSIREPSPDCPYSMCGTQSLKKRSFIDYGWNNNAFEQIVDHKKNRTAIGNALYSALDFNTSNYFFLTDKGNLAALFSKCNLSDGHLSDYDTERAVIGLTNESNKYLKYFYRVRDGFAHGKFVLKYSSNNEKMIIIQDDDKNNVTARIVVKLSTLLNLIDVVDINRIINPSLVKGINTIETVA